MKGDAKSAEKRHMTYYELREAMETRECPICHLAVRAVTSYFSGLLWESVNDAGVREKIRAARGYCNVHMRQMVMLAGSLSLAIIARDLVETMIDDLPDSSPAPRLLPHKRPSASQCPACRVREMAAQRYLTTFVAHLNEPDWRDQFLASKGLCRIHTARARALANGDERQFLMDAARRHLESLKAELDEVIRKNDYRFNGEPWGDERDAPQRAAGIIAGSPGGVE